MRTHICYCHILGLRQEDHKFKDNLDYIENPSFKHSKRIKFKISWKAYLNVKLP